MDEAALIPHLFRTEYRKIISVLCRRFGFEQISVAEDIVSETFLTATQAWGVNGNPGNPAAWLYKVAENKAKNYLRRQVIFDSKIVIDIKKSTDTFYEPEIDLSPQNIEDSQLQMMFAICHPSISREAQIALSLRILCGFGIEEIADAFLTNKETISKRLVRAKEKLREEKIKIELPDTSQIDERLETVLTTIYLFFNEGYYSASKNKTLRKDLCLEAMRLCLMLVENSQTNRPAVNALLSLMCFHASRFDARLDEDGELILYEDQDTDRWNADLVSKGGYFLKCASQGNQLTRYHLQAGIAYWNTQKEDTKEKWENILQFYNRLLQVEYSPVTALNRTYALAKANGKEQAISAAEQLNLVNNHFYFALLGELYESIDNEKALSNLQRALQLVKTNTGRQAIQNKIDQLISSGSPNN